MEDKRRKTEMERWEAEAKKAEIEANEKEINLKYEQISRKVEETKKELNEIDSLLEEEERKRPIELTELAILEGKEVIEIELPTEVKEEAELPKEEAKEEFEFPKVKEEEEIPEVKIEKPLPKKPSPFKKIFLRLLPILIFLIVLYLIYSKLKK
jgi:hypothetical protein